MNRKRALMWGLGLAGAGLVAIAGIVLYELANSNVLHLQSCMQVYPRPFPWLCEQYLYRHHPTPEEVKELNTAAGARFAFFTPAESDGRRLLKHYLEAGIDINAVDEHVDATFFKDAPRRWTALHIAASESNVTAVKLLLEFGASRDVRDATGKTPLELAREVQLKSPTPEREEVIRLLESGKR